jgi:hypothetical protein
MYSFKSSRQNVKQGQLTLGWSIYIVLLDFQIKSVRNGYKKKVSCFGKFAHVTIHPGFNEIALFLPKGKD